MLPDVSAWTASLNAEFEALEARLRPLLVSHPKADAWRLASLLGFDLSRPAVFLLPQAVDDVEAVLACVQQRPRKSPAELMRRGLR